MRRLGFLMCLLCSVFTMAQQQIIKSKWVYTDDTGKLIYKQTKKEIVLQISLSRDIKVVELHYRIYRQN